MEFRVLGPLEVVRDGAHCEPRSSKVRALLLDLLVHLGQVVSRDRLIEDLWGDIPPSTAVGVLQNYVSQLRKALGAEVIATRGQGYALEVGRDAIDSGRFERLLQDAKQAMSEGRLSVAAQQVRAALALWRGTPLADVAFESFAQPEIARLTELRAVAAELDVEIELASGRHEEAVATLEARLAANPLRERLWALLMLALYRSGRQADALRAYQRARAVLAEELGIEPGAQLRELEAAILQQRTELDWQAPGPPVARPAKAGRGLELDIVGRIEERAVVADVARAALARSGSRLLLLLGEPGIGKTRLLDELQLLVERDGGLVLAGRAFEAERGRPYGAWIDACRTAPLNEIPQGLAAELAPLLPELSVARVELDESARLYDAVGALLGQLARTRPIVVRLDDVHWLDEASAGLLHFVVRTSPGGVVVAAAARHGALEDNGACLTVIRQLRREHHVRELVLGPLDADATRRLAEVVAPGIDPTPIVGASNGNPLLILEMARAVRDGEEAVSAGVDALIGERLDAVSDAAAAIAQWLAAFGRNVRASTLAAFVEAELAGLLESLAELERYGILRVAADGTYDFVHDLLRDVAYRRVSRPRRSLLHGRIARVLSEANDPDNVLAADIARHADAGDESSLCAAACVRAARRCLRLLAYADAEALVALGRTHVRHLPAPERVTTELDLIHVLLHPGVRLRDPGELARDLSDLCAEAQRLGLDTELSRGLSLLARAHHWGWGDIPRARALMQRAVQLIDGAHQPNLEPLLEAARCLAYLEVDMDRTARLFDDLGTLHALAAQSVQYQWGLGLVHIWKGEPEPARAALSRAIELSTAQSDHWAAFECVGRLALLELESGAIEAVQPLCAQLTSLADKLGAGSEQHYAAAIGAVHDIAHGDPDGPAALDDAVVGLERIDARFLVPDLLGVTAELHYRSRHLDQARSRAVQAVRVADEVARPFEAARAHALLACLAAERGDLDEGKAQLDAVGIGPGGLPGHVEGLREEAERLMAMRRGEEGVDSWP